MLIQKLQLSLVGVVLLFHFTVPSFAFCQETVARRSIPQAIVAEAKRRLIPLSAIQLRGNQWVACVHNERQGESCITLGSKSAAVSGLDQLKQPNVSRFHRESPRLVRTMDIELIRTYMQQHSQEPYLVVVTVPTLCEPCRRLDVVLHDYHDNRRDESEKMKTFILEYSTFNEAEVAALGKDAIFPTSIVFAGDSESPKPQLPKLAYGISSQSDLETVSKKIHNSFNRRPSGVARGSLDQPSLIAMLQTAEKGRTQPQRINLKEIK